MSEKGQDKLFEDGQSPPPAKRSAFKLDNRASLDVYYAYPRRVGKAAAVKAINAAAARLWAEGERRPYEILLEATTAYAASPAGQKPLEWNGPDYRPHPRTFFSQDRHLDDRAEWQKRNGGDSSPAAKHKAVSDAAKRIADREAERRHQERLAAQRDALDIDRYLNRLTTGQLNQLKADALAALPPTSAKRLEHLDPRAARILRGVMYSHAKKSQEAGVTT